MPSAWLNVPLSDYEGHMQSAEVAQLHVLSDLFAEALAVAKPESVAILGIAGGNGLERIDPTVTKRIVGIDVVAEYLDTIPARFPTLPGLELHHVDLAAAHHEINPVDLVHAALIFEHAGVGHCLDNALKLVKPSGYLAAVLQLPSTQAAGVGASPFTSLQNLASDFQLIDVAEFIAHLARHRFVLDTQTTVPAASGKSLWMGIFQSPA